MSLIACRNPDGTAIHIEQRAGAVYHFARVTWVLFQLVCTTVLLVDVVLWGYLYPQSVSDGNPSANLNFLSYNGT